jgi:ribosomal protein S18 acetylase RimI-like enzyme
MRNTCEINAVATIPVRHAVLRVGKPVTSCVFEGDNLPTTKHFGVFENQNLVGVITVLEKTNAFFLSKKQFQIRGMAVLNEFQHQGYGYDLMQIAEKYIQDQQGNLIWLNARQSAVAFYEKLGYHIIGDSFEIMGIGTHFVMLKEC